MFIYFIFMSIALSVDALGIGITYQLSGIYIPLRTKVIIGIVTTGIMLGALLVGSVFHGNMPGEATRILGAAVLILIGAIFIRNSLFQDEKSTYDFNQSRQIEPMEGLLLAVALSADSVGAGIAVASTGVYQIWLGVMVGLMQLFFLFLADWLVRHVPAVRRFNNKVCGLASGVLLILVGVARLL